MATLLVSFDIAFEDAPTYKSIYSALTSAIKYNLQPNQIWDETTSFYIVETNEDLDMFVKRVIVQAKLRQTKDKIIVFDANILRGRAWGAVDHNRLSSLVSYVKKF